MATKKAINNAPTAQEVFGPEPWVKNPTGMVLTTGASYPYNPYYFANAEPAEKVATMVGGKVIVTNQFCQFGPFTQSHPNRLIKMPDTKDENGEVVKVGITFNAGLFISFWDHGYPQSYIDRLIDVELKG